MCAHVLPHIFYSLSQRYHRLANSRAREFACALKADNVRGGLAVHWQLVVVHEGDHRAFARAEEDAHAEFARARHARSVGCRFLRT